MRSTAFRSIVVLALAAFAGNLAGQITPGRAQTPGRARAEDHVHCL